MNFIKIGNRSYYCGTWESYMNTPAWHRLKRERLILAGHRCEGVDNRNPQYRCSNTSNLEMHHVVYPDQPYALNDKVENVRMLCRDCHEGEYFYDDNRYNEYLFNEACEKED